MGLRVVVETGGRSLRLDLAVLPEHPGDALGKWLKATMLERVLEERPGVVDIRTSNADSNAPMLGINTEMGFEPCVATTTWQMPTALSPGRRR